MIEFNEEIMKKVKQREKEAYYLKRCLDVNICPKCGSDLEHKLFEDGGTEYKCSECTSTYSM